MITSKAKINIFWNFFEWSGPEGTSGVKKKFQKTLILVFEVIVQPPKTHFSTFSKVQKQKKVRPKSWKSHIVPPQQNSMRWHFVTTIKILWCIAWFFLNIIFERSHVNWAYPLPIFHPRPFPPLDNTNKTSDQSISRSDHFRSDQIKRSLFWWSWSDLRSIF